MRLTVFYDYTCGYSFRVWRWLDGVRGRRDDLEVRWATFSLKEANREEGAPSLFEDDEISSISVLALALGHAARERDFEGYHRSVFEAMHGEGARLERGDLLRVAAATGVDVAAFERERPRWLRAVAGEHAGARDGWGVFGTPTLVLGDGSAVFLKFAEQPEPEDAERLLDALWTISVSHPELVEIKRPARQRESQGASSP